MSIWPPEQTNGDGDSEVLGCTATPGALELLPRVHQQLCIPGDLASVVGWPLRILHIALRPSIARRAWCIGVAYFVGTLGFVNMDGVCSVVGLGRRILLKQHSSSLTGCRAAGLSSKLTVAQARP